MCTDNGQFKKARTEAECRASEMLFCDRNYEPLRPTHKFSLGREWISYIDLVKRLKAEAVASCS